MVHQRDLSAASANLEFQKRVGRWCWEEPTEHETALVVEGTDLTLQSSENAGTQPTNDHIVFVVHLPPRGTREVFVKLPASLVKPASRDRLLGLEYASARKTTAAFWEDYLARGASFHVPEATVNLLFRANLWHALRLPRRHGGSEPGAHIDLPYSNFAYDQSGSPWPVNQAVYVDYMLYDLRGYHSISAEELEVMFRNNQQPDGRVTGVANWGVYTPSMVYAVAKHYLLSDDRDSFDRLLPPTLKAVDWCLDELRRAERNSGPTRGLVLAPLNDLSHDSRAWAFNQAYFFAGLDLMAQALGRAKHPRADECRAAARKLSMAIDVGFGHASVQAPIVPLSDRSWTPFVPADAQTPRRLFDLWYPTDVDTGPLHLARLGAINPRGLLTTSLLRDHEDNLFLKGWGMANEPVYNQHATAYLLRDDAKGTIRAFYSMMACAFSHTVFEPVEHRWGWGQYFGPPSTDGAWFELYRNMLIHERDEGILYLFAATPRRWLEHGKRIEIERAPTYFGPLSARLESLTDDGRIRAELDLAGTLRPETLRICIRHPAGKPMRAVQVNGQQWQGFEPASERVEIKTPDRQRYQIEVRY